MRFRSLLVVAALIPLGVAAPTSDAVAQSESSAAETEVRMSWDPDDPRVGLESGWRDAESAIWNLEHVAHRNRPAGFYDREDPGEGEYWNTDLAFQGDHLFQGNYNGFMIYDITRPATPELAVSVVCPGGQGDVSVYADLLVVSTQDTRSRLDCGTQGVQDSVSTERIRGIRIFDISDVRRPQQVAAVQTCRGSHTHTLVPAEDDPDHIYVYIQGTSSPRPSAELAGCSDARPEEDPNTSLFQIEVVRIPLDAPQEAGIVSEPRLFSDRETGEIAGLWEGGDHGPGTQETSVTNRCHDITVYPEIGLAGGACSGNGLLLDISDPADPIRVDEVRDPNFAYWHSATFSNDGSKLVFTDEWGGGRGARCRPSDPPTWGANALFRLNGRELERAGYYKLPVPQTETENCVAHNGSIIPVPGRDLMVQAWYQGGLSVMDFTDPEDPKEIAYFDRGPVDGERLVVGGYWSVYWYNGYLYGAEIARGVDVFRLTPSEHLSEAEIAAAELVELDRFNAQTQPRITWPDAVPVARSYLQQLVRMDRITDERASEVESVLGLVERDEASSVQLERLAERLRSDAKAVRRGDLGGDAVRLEKLAGVLEGLRE